MTLSFSKNSSDVYPYATDCYNPSSNVFLNNDDTLFDLINDTTYRHE